MSKKYIYLDHAATTPPLPCALEAYKNAPFGNPSSEHAAGHAAREALDGAREKIAMLIGAERPEQIIFTGGATEACALALYSASEMGYAVEVPPYEHDAVLDNIRFPKTHTFPSTVYSQMLANNETGQIFAMPNREKMAFIDMIFTDATAAVGHIPVNVENLDVDYLTAGGHKFGGTFGAGFLYARQPERIHPMIYGGGQEGANRSGTENVPAICAMAAALEWQTDRMDENILKIGALRSQMFYHLSEIPNHKWNTPFGVPCVAGILNVSFDGVDAHTLALILSEEGVMVSPGAACTSGKSEPSHVIMAMYNDEARARGALRISMSHQNTPDEITEAAEKIKSAVEYLRSTI